MVVGEQDYVRLTALSAGPAAVPSDVVVTAEFPDNLAIDPITNNPYGWVCDTVGQTVTCDVASLPPGAPRYVDVPVTPVSPGSGLVVSAEVSTTSVDPDVSNNTLVSSTFDVAANEADLSLTQVFVSDLSMVVGEQDYVRLTALSAGPPVPSDVVVTAEFPEIGDHRSRTTRMAGCVTRSVKRSRVMLLRCRRVRLGMWMST